MQITTNFKLEEFAPSGNVPGYIENNIRALAQQLQKLRDHFNAPISILKGLSETGSNEQKLGSGAIFTVSGKNGDQVKAALETLINNGQIINGTIGLYDKNHVYFALTPIGQRFDKRTTTPTTGGGSSTAQNNGTPAVTQVEKTNKNLMMVALVLGLLVAGTIMLKNDKPKKT